MNQNDATRHSDSALSSRLLRSLAHIIRGDLSVINNDLVYLSSIVGEGELERARARCAHMAALVGKLRVLSSEEARVVLSGAELAAILGAAVESNAAIVRVSVDSDAMMYVASALKDLLGHYSAIISRSQDDTAAVTSLSLVVTRNNPPCVKEPLLLSRDAPFSSLAQVERGERAVIDGCIIDMVFRRHGWLVDISRQSEVRVTIPCEPIRL